MFRFFLLYTHIIPAVLCLWLLPRLTAAQTREDNLVLGQLARLDPAQRVRLLLNHYDASRPIAKNQARAFRLFNRVDSLGSALRDDQLRQYGQLLRDTYDCHQTTDPAHNAARFLAVGQQAEHDGHMQIAAVCRHQAGQYYFLAEDYGRAFEHLLAANEQFRAIGYERIPAISYYLYEMAVDYFYFQEYNKAVGLLQKIRRYPALNENSDIQTFNTLGMAYTWLYSLGDTSAARPAEWSYRKAQERASVHRDTLWIGIAAGNLARHYDNQQQWAKALPHYRTSYQIGMKYGENRSLPTDPALNMAKAYINLGQVDSGRFYLNQALVFFRHGLQVKDETELGNEYFRRDYCNVSRQYYRAIGDFPTAYRYLDSLNTLNKAINKRYNSKQVSLVNQKLMIQKHQSEVERLQTASRVQLTRTWLIGGALALLAGLFFRLYQLARLRRRQEAVINEEQEKSLRLEKQALHLEKQLVEEQLRQATADLDQFMEKLDEKNALIDSITAQLAENLATPGDVQASKPLVETQQHLLNATLLTHDDWHEFRRRFDRVHPHFFAHLKAQFSDLSPAEERLLALAKLRVDTRHMSRMLGISPESIRKTRYRLRKKLGIAGHSPLRELFNDLPEGTPNP